MRQLNLRILIVDDHALMREAVRAILADAEGLELVGEAATGAEALRKAAELNPDLILLDLGLPDVEGLTCLENLRRQHPGVAIIIFSGVEDTHVVDSALARGAAGFVLKRINPLDLAAMLRQSVECSVFRQPTVPVDVGPPSGLTAKEIAILEQLALGLSNREIAKEMWISDQTVKFHLRSVYRKLGVSTRTEAILVAHERALVPAS